MKYVKAFNSLGYSVPNPRQDWSAEKKDGICVTFWKTEVQWIAPPPQLDLWSLGSPGEIAWERKPGHALRTRHLRRAVAEFDGWVDAIIVAGVPGDGYGSADPWIPGERMNHQWRIQTFNADNGFFTARATKRPAA